MAGEHDVHLLPEPFQILHIGRGFLRCCGFDFVYEIAVDHICCCEFAQPESEIVGFLAEFFVFVYHGEPRRLLVQPFRAVSGYRQFCAQRSYRADLCAQRSFPGCFLLHCQQFLVVFDSFEVDRDAPVEIEEERQRYLRIAYLLIVRVFERCVATACVFPAS